MSVDGAVARDPAMRLAEARRSRFEAPAAEESPLLGEDLPLDVVFEDEHLLVVDKPAGLVVHPAPGHAEGTLVNALIAPLRREPLGRSAGSGARALSIGSTRTRPAFWSSPRPTPPIRASPTSSPTTAAAVRSMREYLALVWGGFDAAAGKVDAAIGRHPPASREDGGRADERGRRAVTHWRVEEGSGRRA